MADLCGLVRRVWTRIAVLPCDLQIFGNERGADTGKNRPARSLSGDVLDFNSAGS